jgi:SNF2 family DNA or RNA helicase
MEQKELYQQIDANDEFAAGCLMLLYSFQTEDEKAIEATNWENNIGFNGADAGFCSSVAKFYLKSGTITPGQMKPIKKIIKKYHRQLLEFSYKIQPAKLKKNGQAKKQQLIIKFKRVDYKDGKLIISWQTPKGDPEWKQTLMNIKSLDGTRWAPDLPGKPWVCQANLINLWSLEEWGFELQPDARIFHDTMVIEPEFLKEVNPPFCGPADPMPFQKTGIEFLNKTGGRGLIGDEMGLGKTLQAIGWLTMNPKAIPAVVICPASLKLNWAREIKKWTGDRFSIHIVNGKANNGTTIPPDADIYVINYDIFSNSYEAQKKGGKKNIEIPFSGWVDYLIKIGVKTLVLDEVHYCKSNTANRTKSVKKMAKHCEHIIGLSGTPIVNKPIEFYNAISMINPMVFPGWRYYVTKFCNGYQGAWGWEVNGHSNEDLLHKIMTKTIMLRRKKADVLDQLPAKIRSVVPLQITNRNEYSKAQEDIIEWIEKNIGREAANKASQAEALVEFEKLKQLAGKGKQTAMLEWIDNFLESDEKLIIFAHHKKIVDLLMDHLGKIAVKIDGSTPNKARMAVVDAFQEDPDIKVFVGTLAAKEGLTLTAASNVAFAELFWTPGDHDQAEDRCYGRLSDLHGANIWYLIAENTVEEKIADLLDKKRKVLAAVLDGEVVEEISLLTSLIKEMKNESK